MDDDQNDPLNDLGAGPESWTYWASLWADTPLAVLLHHGDTVPADGIRMEYGRHGHWMPNYRTFSMHLGGDGNTVSSIGGQVPADGGDVLPFLIAYRRVIEDASRSVHDRVATVREIIDDPTYARFSRLLDDRFATGWVVGRLCDSLNIGGGPANALVNHGCLEVADVLALDDAALRAMPGIGPKTITAIKLQRKRRGG